LNKTLSTTATLIALAGSIFIWPVRAQTSRTPNFSGQWVAEPSPLSDPPESPMSRPPICYQQCVITQTADTLLVKDTMNTNRFRLDGLPVSTPHTYGAETTTMTDTANWEGAVLVITRVAMGPKR